MLTCPISNSVTPKTATLYYEKVYAAQAESREIYDQVVQGKLDAMVDCTIYSGQNTTNAEIKTAIFTEILQQRNLKKTRKHCSRYRNI